MSDKKDKSGADLEANLAKIANTKPRRRNRKDNIYERFITRVENIEETENLESLQADSFDTSANSYTDGNHTDADMYNGLEASLLEKSIQESPLKPLKNADQLSSYEPLSAAELDLFAIQEQNDLDKKLCLQVSDDSTTSVSLDFSDNQEGSVANFSTSETLDDVDYSGSINDADKSVDNHGAIEVDTINDNNESISSNTLKEQPLAAVISKKSKAAKLTQKQASNKKPLILGMALGSFGSLIIAGAVLTLIGTGMLSTEPNAVKTPVTENATQTSPANKPATNGSEQNIVRDANTKSTTPSVAGELTEEDLKRKSQQAQATGDEAAVSTSKADPAITYEDFREESQSTLYRETND